MLVIILNYVKPLELNQYWNCLRFIYAHCFEYPVDLIENLKDAGILTRKKINLFVFYLAY